MRALSPESRGSRPPFTLGGLCRLEGAFAVACRDGVFALNPDDFGIRGLLARPHVSFDVAPPNDLGVHPKGHVLIATADNLERCPTGGLFALVQGGMQRIAGGYTVGNGPAFSPDGCTMYVADSARGFIYAYDWDEKRLSAINQRVFASIPESRGLPDGLAVDAEGGIWNARWGGASVVRYAPSGAETAVIELPARRVTGCAFGGSSLKTLYITTACLKDGREDLGGLLFEADVGIAGCQAPAGVIY